MGEGKHPPGTQRQPAGEEEVLGCGVCLHGAGISFILQYQHQTWQELLLTAENHSLAAKLIAVRRYLRTGGEKRH